jgi:two-component system phosphate regulon response regulator PhoB/two-component system alkaline phosphatase synthesis response regulator PhoP
MIDSHASEDDVSHVLVIDDDATFRGVVRRAIEQEGFKVVEGDGCSALALARGSRPGLMLLDLRMPGVSGLQILHALRSDKLTASIPVIIVSATTDDDVTRETIVLGAAGYLYKTHFSVPELRRLVKEHMSKKSAA